MNDTVSHICHLILRHECVVVPQLGAFIATRQPASYDAQTGVFLPPSRTVSFNSTIAVNDGLLAASIARKEGIPFEEAGKKLSAEIASLNAQLEQDGEISIGFIGRLRKSHNSAPEFLPSEQLTSVQNGFLQPVTPSRIDVDEDIKEIRHDASRSPYFKPWLSSLTKTAAVIALVLGTVYALLVPVFGERVSDNMASAGITTSTFTANSQTSIVPGKSIAHELKIAMPKLHNVEDKQSNITETTPGTEITPKYYLIVASLPTRAGAEQFITDNHGLPQQLDILEQDGKYRVYIATAQTSAEALALKSSQGISSRYPDAWVCAKK